MVTLFIKDPARLSWDDVHVLGSYGPDRYVRFREGEYLLDRSPLPPEDAAQPLVEGDIRLVEAYDEVDEDGMRHRGNRMLRGRPVPAGTFAELTDVRRVRAERAAAQVAPRRVNLTAGYGRKSSWGTGKSGDLTHDGTSLLAWLTAAGVQLEVGAAAALGGTVRGGIVPPDVDRAIASNRRLLTAVLTRVEVPCERDPKHGPAVVTLWPDQLVCEECAR